MSGSIVCGLLAVFSIVCGILLWDLISVCLGGPGFGCASRYYDTSVRIHKKRDTKPWNKTLVSSEVAAPEERKFFASLEVYTKEDESGGCSGSFVKGKLNNYLNEGSDVNDNESESVLMLITAKHCFQVPGGVRDMIVENWEDKSVLRLDFGKYTAADFRGSNQIDIAAVGNSDAGVLYFPRGALGRQNDIAVFVPNGDWQKKYSAPAGSAALVPLELGNVEDFLHDRSMYEECRFFGRSTFYDLKPQVFNARKELQEKKPIERRWQNGNEDEKVLISDYIDPSHVVRLRDTKKLGKWRYVGLDSLTLQKGDWEPLDIFGSGGSGGPLVCKRFEGDWEHLGVAAFSVAGASGFERDFFVSLPPTFGFSGVSPANSDSEENLEPKSRRFQAGKIPVMISRLRGRTNSATDGLEFVSSKRIETKSH